MAEVYKATGDYAAAASAYERILGTSKNAALLAAIYAETATLYRYDLRDPAKCQVYFRELADAFPASPFSSMEKRLLQREAEKNIHAFGEGPSPKIGSAEGGTAVPPSVPLLGPGTPLMRWLEDFLPIFVEVFSDRLARYMQVVGQKELTRKFSELEFREQVMRRVREKFPGQLTSIETKIHPAGFVGSGTVHLGILTIPVEAKIGIEVQEERPHAIIRQVRVGGIPIPEMLLKILQERVNLKIDKTKSPLRVKKYELKEGYALISVTLVSEGGSSN